MTASQLDLDIEAQRQRSALFSSSSRPYSDNPDADAPAGYRDHAESQNLSNTQIGALSAAQVGTLSNPQLAELTADQIANLSNTALAGLKPAQITALSDIQLEGLSKAQAAALTATQVAAWGAATLQAFGDDPARALAAARERWAGRELVALVADGQQERPLTGMHGYAATEGREAGLALAQVLEADREGERWLEALGLEQGPGSGAAGGLGLLIQAMGGRVVDPLTYLAERFSLENTLTQADVVVTGAERLDFHAVGGPIVKRVVALAEAALRPAVAIVGRNYVSARELRLAGLETAYPLLPGAGEETSTPERLVEVAQQVATTWSW